MWLQKNNDINSHEAMDMQHFPLIVMPSGIVATISDGVNLDALRAPGTGVYYGTYKHATALSSGAYGAVSGRKNNSTPILWRVMGEEQSGGDITLLSEYVLDSRPFHGVATGGNYYNNSDIRGWLNSGTGFLGNFLNAERGGIATTRVVTGMHDQLNGTPKTGLHKTSIDSFSYSDPLPWTALGDKVYLLWGKYHDKSVYWSSDMSERQLSGNTAATLKNGTFVHWWLRSPSPAFSIIAFAVFHPADNFATTVSEQLGVRPAFKLHPEFVVFSSPVKSGANAAKGETEAVYGYSAAAEGGVAQKYKLTILNWSAGETLSGVPSEKQTVAIGNAFTLNDLMPSKTVSPYTVNYKIVGSNGAGGREIKAYGYTETQETFINLTLHTESLPAGNYTAYVWLQKNNETNSHEAMDLQAFPLSIVDPSAPTVESVSISPLIIEVQQGSTQQFAATVSGTNAPSQEVTWSLTGQTSTATNISASGLVTVGADETAERDLTVTTISAADTNIFGTATVRVIPTRPISTVESVSVSPAAIEVQQGSTQQFSAMVIGTDFPPQDVTWSTGGQFSTATDISTDGLLSVGADETATSLTVTATSAEDAGKSGVVIVTVTSAPPAPSYGVSLNHSGTFAFPAAIAGYGAQAAETVTIFNTGNQPTGTLSIQLSSSNSAAFALSAGFIASIAVGSNSSFTIAPIEGLAAGTYDATVTVSGDNGISASFGVSFTVNAALPVQSDAKDVIGVTAPSGASIDASTITATVANSVSSQTIDLVVSEKASWKLYGDAGCTSEISSKIMALSSVGENTAYVQVTAENGSKKVYALTITREGPEPAIKVTAINIQGGGSIAVKNGTLQLFAEVSPSNAANRVVTWSIVSGGGFAPVNSTGLVSAKADGTIKVRATAQNGSNVYGEKTIAITEQNGGSGGPDEHAYLSRTLTDSATGTTVFGLLHRNAALTVRNIVFGSSAACDSIRLRMNDNNFITLFSKDVSITHGFIGTLTITIPVDGAYNGKIVTVLHGANGALETYTATVWDGKATFTVTGLSPLAVFVDSSQIAIPKTGDDGAFHLWLGLMAAGVLLSSLSLLLRRKPKRA